MSRDRDGELVLDDIDRRLLEALQLDCKRSFAELGEEVGLSAPSVYGRVKKLEEAGIVRAYSAQLDPRRLGLDIGAFIGVAMDHPRHIASFEAYVAEKPEVLECHHVTGPYTLMLKVRTEDTSTLHALIQLLRAADGVKGTETMIVLATQIERTAVLVPAPPSRRRPR